MDNPAGKVWRSVGLVFLGIFIGFVPGLIRVDQMKQDAENSETFHLRAVADLKRQMHDEETFYLKQMSIYRAELGIRRVPPTQTDKAIGIICAEEFGVGQIVGSGIRSWKPRSDGRCYAEDAQ